MDKTIKEVVKEIDKILSDWNINQPKTEEETNKRIKEFKELAKDNFQPIHTIKSGRLKGSIKGILGTYRFLKSGDNYVLGW